MTVVTYISMSVLMSNVLCFILQTDRLNHGRMQLILRQLRLQQSSFIPNLPTYLRSKAMEERLQ